MVVSTPFTILGFVIVSSSLLQDEMKKQKDLLKNIKKQMQKINRGYFTRCVLWAKKYLFNDKAANEILLEKQKCVKKIQEGEYGMQNLEKEMENKSVKVWC